MTAIRDGTGVDNVEMRGTRDGLNDAFEHDDSESQNRVKFESPWASGGEVECGRNCPGRRLVQPELGTGR